MKRNNAMKKLLAGLTIAMTMGAVAVPATADPLVYGTVEIVRDGRDYRDRDYGGYDVLPERRIERLVYRSGFAEIEDIHLRRDRYVVTAVRPNGAVFRLALDAYDGGVIARERIGWSRGYDRRDYDRHRGGPRGIEFRFDLGG